MALASDVIKKAIRIADKKSLLEAIKSVHDTKSAKVDPEYLESATVIGYSKHGVQSLNCEQNQESFHVKFKIRCSIGSYTWCVSTRYSQLLRFHTELLQQHGDYVRKEGQYIELPDFPSKSPTIFGWLIPAWNHASESFIEGRIDSFNVWLQSLLEIFPIRNPD